MKSKTLYKQKSKPRAAILLTIVLESSLFVLIYTFSSQEYWQLLASVIVATNIAVYVWTTLWKRDGILPLFDIGAVCIAATWLYTVLPLLQLYAASLGLTKIREYRFLRLNVSPQRLGAYPWWFVVYLLSLGIAYLFFRQKSSENFSMLQKLRINQLHALVICFGASSVYLLVLDFSTGFTYNVSYSDLEQFRTGFSDLPVFVRQITNVVRNIYFLFKIGVLALIMTQYKHLRWRLVLFAWIAFEVISSIRLMGARTDLALFLLAVVLLYHRLVKPFSLPFIIMFSGLFIAGFMLFGIVRGMAVSGSNRVLTQDDILSRGNEFFGIFMTGYHVYWERISGRLIVPLSVRLYELVAFIPQQLLPFQKLSPAYWYLDEFIGSRQTGHVFGTMAQAAMGFGIIELIVRGGLLGYFLARIHHWYTRRSTNFFALLLYTWLCVRIYNTFRTLTFSLVPNVIYFVIPGFFIFNVASAILKPHLKEKQLF